MSDPAERFSLAGDTAVITGASGGIGRAIAETFAADGADVDHRIGTSEEIADVARFLVSDAASDATGETVVARGVPQAEDSPEA